MACWESICRTSRAAAWWRARFSLAAAATTDRLGKGGLLEAWEATPLLLPRAVLSSKGGRIAGRKLVVHGGGGRIRTSVGRSPADLQSQAGGHPEHSGVQDSTASPAARRRPLLPGAPDYPPEFPSRCAVSVTRPAPYLLVREEGRAHRPLH